MAFYSNDIIARVESVCRIRYMGRGDVTLWNQNRRGEELRLLTGWMWTAKDGSAYQQGIKSYAACVRDAYYALVIHKAAPGDVAVRRAKLKVVA